MSTSISICKFYVNMNAYYNHIITVSTLPSIIQTVNNASLIRTFQDEWGNDKMIVRQVDKMTKWWDDKMIVLQDDKRTK